MGHGIAQVFAGGGYRVHLRDINKEVTEAALNRIRLNLEMFIQKGLTTKDKLEFTLSNIETTTDMATALEKAEFAVEVAPEILEIKREVFREMEAFSPEGAILASNTSSYKITEIASSISHPERVVGTHWMNPAQILPLVEVVKAEKTSDQTLETTVKLIEKLGKTTIVCKDVAGFIVNRMQAAMFNEAISLVEKGICTMEEADKAWTYHLGLRFALMGPIKALDSSGLDTWHSIFGSLYGETGQERFKLPEMLKKAVEEGKMGFKNGKGFYDYAGKSIDAIIDERNERTIWLLKEMGLLGE